MKGYAGGYGGFSNVAFILVLFVLLAIVVACFSF